MRNVTYSAEDLRKFHELERRMRLELESDILPFWLPYIDREVGGFYGQVRNDGGFTLNAIDAAWSERGVAVLVDLGGAETNSEMAIEMQPAERQGHIQICNAPIVEGAVIAAAEASGGSSLEAVRQAAEELYPR